MINSGDIIIDGSTKWIVRNMRYTPSQSAAPVGAFLAMAGTVIPDGYLLCDGAAISRTDYADLFAVTGTLYGVGDESTTFNIPNLSDRRMLQGVISDNIGLYYESGLPNITGWCVSTGTSCIKEAGGAIVNRGTVTYQTGSASSTHPMNGFEFNAQASNIIYGASDRVQPKALNVRFFIKY